MTNKQLEKAVDVINAYVDQLEAYADNLTIKNVNKSDAAVMDMIVSVSSENNYLRKVASGEVNNDNAYEPFLALDTLRRKRDAEKFYGQKKLALM